MDWITDQIAIGTYREAADTSLLVAQGIRSVLSLDGTRSEVEAEALGLAEVVGYRLIDGEGNDPRLFRLTIDDLQRLVETVPPVLVQCHAGRSRSAIVVAAYLMRAHGLGPADAIARVASRREINITAELVELLET